MNTTPIFRMYPGFFAQIAIEPMLFFLQSQPIFLFAFALAALVLWNLKEKLKLVEGGRSLELKEDILRSPLEQTCTFSAYSVYFEASLFP